MKKYFVIFGGGGIRGIAYCGAYNALIKNDVQISGLAGSSIGAVFAVLLSLKYSGYEIFEIFSDTGVGLFTDLNFGVKNEIAVSKGQKFYDWIKTYIEQKFYGSSYKKGQMPPVTFKDIEKNLVIYAVDLAKMQFKEFSRRLTPDFEVAKAVRASVSMPGLFTPLIEDDMFLVDGDLLKSSPLWRMSDTIKYTEDRILEFRLEDTTPKENITNPIEYFNRVYNAFCGFSTDYIIDVYGKKDKFDYIKINTPDVSVVDFLIPKTKKQELFDIGYSTTDEYFLDRLSEKRKILYNKYTKLLEMFINFQKKFSKKDYCASYVILCEIFVYLCEEKLYIDASIYERIVEFKNLYFDSYIKSNILNFNRGGLKKNAENIHNIMLEILKTLTVKTEELNS